MFSFFLNNITFVNTTISILKTNEGTSKIYTQLTLVLIKLQISTNFNTISEVMYLIRNKCYFKNTLTLSNTISKFQQAPSAQSNLEKTTPRQRYEFTRSKPNKRQVKCS